MTDDARVQQLLIELLDSQATPEVVCESCPELLPVVRDRWRQMCRVRADLDVLFPPPDAPTPQPPGEMVLPRIPGYEVEAVLGRGGMGIVFRAQHLGLKRLIALKMALAGAYAESRERERFQREAEAVASLRHANIVQVHDVGEHDGRPYFTMEFVEGGSLARKLAGQPQPARSAATLVATLAGAVQVAHASGIIHRDLKPANILLTADGTPKITDFGLARRLEGGAGVTQSGVAMGTPSYMAPEQARGQSRAIGLAVDVYALGAILYELLTGRPPFRGETPAETVQQVIHQEPVPPSRLNVKVPRDLETICLKCLAKAPPKRYATAAALAEDLQRYQRGEAIAARRVGLSERLLRWIRRNPTAAVLIVTALALLGLAVGVGAREWARAAERRAERANWAARLQDGIRLQQEGRLPEARAILDGLPDAGSDDLRQRIERARADLSLAQRLDGIRMNRAVLVRGSFDLRVNKARADQDYAEAFRTAGLGDSEDTPEQVAARVEASDIRRALVAALDDWAVCTTDQHRRSWLLRVAQKADPDPTGWRDRARDPEAWNNPKALAELARAAPVEGQTLQLLVALGERLQDANGDAIPVLKQVQQKYPGDFWANFALGEALRQKADPREAIAYFQAALALRPGAAVAHNNLGVVVALNGRIDVAIDHFRRSLDIDPGFSDAHSNLGSGLQTTGQHAEALDQHRQAVRLDPGRAGHHSNLGIALAEGGQFDEAIRHYREALRLDPRSAITHNNLGNALKATGHVDEAIDHYRQALCIRPQYAEAHNNLGDALRVKGQLNEAIGHLRQSIVLDIRNPRFHNNLGIALVQAERPAEAIDHFQQALRINPKLTSAHTNLGLALMTDPSRLDEAIDHLQQALRLDPKLAHAHGALGQALLTRGRYREAQAATRRSLELLPPNHPLRAGATRQLQHCEHLLALEARLPAVLQGKDRPASAAEWLELAETCRIRKQYAATARLFADAFAAWPQLAADVRAAHRYNAACAAARAGCWSDKEGEKLSEDERARWRKEARGWLRADLAAWKAMVHRDPGANRSLVQKNLTHWQADPDLAGLRDPQALGNLPPSEQEECRALWNEVRVLWRHAQSAEPQ